MQKLSSFEDNSSFHAKERGGGLVTTANVADSEWNQGEPKLQRKHKQSWRLILCLALDFLQERIFELSDLTCR